MSVADEGHVDAFPLLLSPITLGSVEVRNRVVFTAHGTNMAEDQLPDDRLVAYHRERARGGVGLIVFEVSAVHRSSGLTSRVHAYKPEVVPWYERIAEAVHEHGAKMVVQLYHPGINASFYGSFNAAWGPSRVPSIVYRGESPHVMDRDEIDEIVQAFHTSAQHVAAAGMDGVEIHGAHGYLLEQFLSPAYNRRDDEYGGSLENRLRFSLRVVDAVRAAVGDGKIVGMRVSGDELIDGGLTLADVQEAVQKITARCRLDYVSVSIGTYHHRHLMAGPAALGAGYQLPLAEGIKRAVPDVPVICVGRITSPAFAEQVLAEGKADLVGMTRAQIADPELVNKARAGRANEIRTCIGSNQGCRGAHFFGGKPISCTVNPAVGHEEQFGTHQLLKAKEPKRVLVVGGGPAGLKVAEIAARRGHSVTLCEKESELGGQIRLAARLPYHDQFAAATQHLVGQLEKENVEIVRDCEVDKSFVLEHAPDAVVVATGARSDRSGFTGLDLSVDRLRGADLHHVLVPEDVLSGAPVGKNVLVLDEETTYKAMGLAEFLADAGHKVRIVSSAQVVGTGFMTTGDWQLAYPRLLAKGVEFSPMTVVGEIGEGVVAARHSITKEPIDFRPVDTVVLVTGGVATDDLYRELKGHVDGLHCIGDACSPRHLDAAIFEGDRLGRTL